MEGKNEQINKILHSNIKDTETVWTQTSYKTHRTMSMVRVELGGARQQKARMPATQLSGFLRGAPGLKRMVAA